MLKDLITIVLLGVAILILGRWGSTSSNDDNDHLHGAGGNA